MAAHLARFCRSRFLCSTSSISRVCSTRSLQTTSCVRGLEDFFPPGVLEKGEFAPEKVKTGRRWRAGELRIKSNEDMHKLWYVLLKERNMLDTLMHESRRQGVPMPSPERYHKVKKSMAMIKLVLGERERAIQELAKQQWPFEVAEDTELDENTDNTMQRINLNENDELSESEPSTRKTAIATMSKTEIPEQETVTVKDNIDGLGSTVLKPT